MIKALTFDNLSRHYNILPKPRSRMTTAVTLSRQNEAGSPVSNTQYWENLVLVVVLVSESKALYWGFTLLRVRTKQYATFFSIIIWKKAHKNFSCISFNNAKFPSRLAPVVKKVANSIHWTW